MRGVARLHRGRAGAFLETFVEYPPSQPPASFSVDQIRKSVDEQIARLKRQAQPPSK